MRHEDWITIPNRGVIPMPPLIRELLDTLCTIIAFLPSSSSSDGRHICYQDQHILIVYDTLGKDIDITLLFPNNHSRTDRGNGAFSYNFASRTMSSFHFGYNWLRYVLTDLSARAKKAEYSSFYLRQNHPKIPPSTTGDHSFDEIDDDNLFL